MRNAGDGPTVKIIRIDHIDVVKQLMRSSELDDTIQELASDIAARGLLQPIGVAARDKGRFELLYGRRRLEAHKRLKRSTIPAIIRDTEDADITETALAENLHRRQMTLEEECAAVAHLHNTNRTPDQIASVLSVTRSWVLRRLAIPQLPPDIRAALLDDAISITAAETLAEIADEQLRAQALNQTVVCRLTARDVRNMVDTLHRTPTMAQAIDAGAQAANTPLPPTRVIVTCTACNHTRDINDTVIVRVCADGCAASKQLDLERTPQ